MDISSVNDIMYQTIWTIITLSAPPLLVGMSVGVIVSLVQAVVQVQEQTISFVPKVVAILFTCVLLYPAFIQTMNLFTQNLYDKITITPE